MKALISYYDKVGHEKTAMIADSAITRAKDPFFVPDERKWIGMPLYGIRIDRLGKGINLEFAERYYNECLSAVHPFACEHEDTGVAKWARDGALIISEGSLAENLSSDFKNQINRLISLLSESITLKTGDLILIGEPDASFPIEHRSYNVEIPEFKGCRGFKFKIR